jgi:hypothetical protein
LQLARFKDYISLAGGFVYAGGGSKAKPEFIGPSFDLIIMPAYVVHLSLSYGQMNGTVGGLEYEFGGEDVVGRVEYQSTDMAANFLVRIMPDVELSLGYILAESKISSDGKSKNNKMHFGERGVGRQLGLDLVPHGNSISVGIRGTLL